MVYFRNSGHSDIAAREVARIYGPICSSLYTLKKGTNSVFKNKIQHKMDRAYSSVPLTLERGLGSFKGPLVPPLSVNTGKDACEWPLTSVGLGLTTST